VSTTVTYVGIDRNPFGYSDAVGVRARLERNDDDWSDEIVGVVFDCISWANESVTAPGGESALPSAVFRLMTKRVRTSVD